MSPLNIHTIFASHILTMLAKSGVSAMILSLTEFSSSKTLQCEPYNS